MNAFAATQKYDEIRKLIAYLSMEEQLRLIGEISINLQKKIPPQPHAPAQQTAHAGRIRGKYAHVPTSSERFAAMKQIEIEQER